MDFIIFIAFMFVQAYFGLQASAWYSEVKKLRAQNERIQKELLDSNRENYELKMQLGLPPHRRLPILSEPAVSEAPEEKGLVELSSSLSDAGGAGLPPMMMLMMIGAKVMADKKKKEKKDEKRYQEDKDFDKSSNLHSDGGVVG